MTNVTFIPNSSCYWVLIGCDTTSAFYAKSKVTALKIARIYEKYAILFGNMGTTIAPSTQLKNDLYGFVCNLYGFEECSDVTLVALTNALWNVILIRMTRNWNIQLE